MIITAIFSIIIINITVIFSIIIIKTIIIIIIIIIIVYKIYNFLKEIYIYLKVSVN